VQCSEGTGPPIKIESQYYNSVTFHLPQVWKGCRVDDGAAVAPDLFGNAESKFMCVGKVVHPDHYHGVVVIDVYATADDETSNGMTASRSRHLLCCYSLACWRWMEKCNEVHATKVSLSDVIYVCKNIICSMCYLVERSPGNSNGLSKIIK
jgi:hypothetical protein